GRSLARRLLRFGRRPGCLRSVDQLPHRQRRLRALGTPRRQPLRIHLEELGRAGWVIQADLFDELAVARRLRVCDDDTKERPLLAAVTGETDLHHGNAFPRSAREAGWQPLHHRTRAELLENLFGLSKLLEQTVDVGYRRAAAERDTLAPVGVQDVDVAPLLFRHRVDDRLDALQLALGVAHLGATEQLLDARDHAEQLGDRAHLAHRAELVPEVLQVERVHAQLLLADLGLRTILGLLDPLDQREHVAHAENARRDPVRVEGLEGVELLAGAREHDRLAGDGAQRERGAATRVALDLREHDARERQAVQEPLGGGHRVLARHRVRAAET